MNALRCHGLFLILAAAGGLARAQTATDTLSGLPADQARAQAAMADLSQRLRSALVAKMQTGGPLAAVAFCHAQAPGIATEVSVEHGIAVGRTALRVRNRANAPLPWQDVVLMRFVQEVGAGTPAGQLQHVERENGRLRLARGIATEGPCLLCHGSDIAEPVRAAILARYPDDAATGFSEGDLRGLIWAEVPDTGGSIVPHPSRP